MATKGVPLQNGSGRGVGANRGRGGCTPPRGGRRGAAVGRRGVGSGVGRGRGLGRGLNYRRV